MEEKQVHHRRGRPTTYSSKEEWKASRAEKARVARSRKKESEELLREEVNNLRRQVQGMCPLFFLFRTFFL